MSRKIHSMAAYNWLLCTALLFALELSSASLISSHNSDLSKWRDVQDDGLEKRDVSKTWKKGPPPGWWYHTNGHPERKRFITSPKDILRKDDVHGDNLVEEFLVFLRLKDSGLLDMCIGHR